MATDSPQVIVTALFRSQPGRENDTRTLLQSLVSTTRAEAGCIRYDLHEATDQPGSFAFLETWRSEPDLERHLASSHIRMLRERLPALVAQPPVVTVWRQIS